MLRLLILISLTLGTASTAWAGTLFDAASAGDIDEVTRLLTAGADVNAREGRDGATPLHAAALASQPAMAEVLIAHGADVNALNVGGFTPLHAAAYSGSVPVAELLLDKGAVVDEAAKKFGVTPLLVAGEQDNLAVAELLIARGADVSARERHGYTPLTRAFFKQHDDIVRLLKRHGATCQGHEVIGSEIGYRQCLEGAIYQP
jgi:uncharacterized protein